MQLGICQSGEGIPANAEPIPGFGGDYFITPRGEVWSIKWGGPRRLEQFSGDGGPRVCLSRNNRRYRPDVSTLLRRTFGVPEPRSDARLIRKVLDEYGDDPAVLAWAESL